MAKSGYIAVDLGAESGRVMLAELAGGKISLREMHRFSNGPTQEGDSLRWDFNKLMNEITTGIGKAAAACPNARSIGVDTWGVDFGLLDKSGKLIENPYHYRDSRNNGMMEKVFAIVPRQKVYMHTGIQFMQFNSLYQLFAYKTQKPDVVAKADKLLFMPDLIVYALTGFAGAEYTIASTSQMVDMKTSKWADDLISALDLPRRILPDLVMPGIKVGALKKDLADKLGCTQIPVVESGGHDTASAVAGVPAAGNRPWAYLSSGTWSLMGIETPMAVVNETSMAMDVTNEGGVLNTIRLLKNIMGLWLVQECRRQWAKEGQELDYGQLAEMAAVAKPFAAVISTEQPEFMAIGDMPNKINAYLTKTGQKPIQDKGQMIRVILESLAVRYAEVMSMLEKLGGKKIEVLHIVGGGTKNELLNQFTADATGKTVMTGPVEATVLGNVLMQAVTAGDVMSLTEGRKIIADSFEMKTYSPKAQGEWKTYIETYRKLCVK
ncbi:MAG: rhamnulokinase family protein [Anaerohalosphaeraceae bacterium]